MLSPMIDNPARPVGTVKPVKTLNLTLLTTSFPRFEGDFAGSFVHKYARELARAGCRVRVIAPHDVEVADAGDADNIERTHFRYLLPARWQALAYGAGMIPRIRHNPLRLLQLPLFLASFFVSALKAAKSTDVFQTFWSLSAVVALAVKAVTGKPVVVRLTGADIHFLRLRGVAPLFARLLNTADGIVCQSQQFKQELAEAGVRADRITILTNGIELERFHAHDKSEARRRLGLPQAAPLVLTVGRLSPSKGHAHLLKAAAAIRERVADAVFVLVGDGDLRAELESQAAALGLDGAVMFAGSQKQSEIPLWLSAADVFALPSLLDGSPNILLEAMACGLPIVATTVGGIPEMITDGHDGLLIAPGSSEALARKLTDLLEDPVHRKLLSDNAGETVRTQYGTWQAQTARLVQIYKKRIQAGAPSPAARPENRKTVH